MRLMAWMRARFRRRPPRGVRAPGTLGARGWYYRDGIAPAPQDFVVRRDPYAKKPRP